MSTDQATSLFAEFDLHGLTLAQPHRDGAYDAGAGPA